MVTTLKPQVKDEKGPKPEGRRIRKRSFPMPQKMPWPVRGLWDVATEEERKKAHETSVQLLQMWLGRQSRTEVAASLGMPLLRVWQLSQQALAGMVAGLLKQPKVRPKKGALADGPGMTELKGKVTRLEKQLMHAEHLIDLLRQMPARRADEKSEEGRHGNKAKAHASGQAGHRTKAAGHEGREAGTSGGGEGRGRDGAHGA